MSDRLSDPSGRRTAAARGLAAVLDDFGAQVATNPARLRAMLSDRAQGAVRCRAEIDALVAVAAAGPVTSDRPAPADLRPAGIADDDALWAIQTWRDVLGLDPGTIASGQVRPRRDVPSEGGTRPGEATIGAQRIGSQRTGRSRAAVAAATAVALALVAVAAVYVTTRPRGDERVLATPASQVTPVPVTPVVTTPAPATREPAVTPSPEPAVTPSAAPAARWRLAYMCQVESVHDICMQSADAPEPRRLTSGSSYESAPAWSPDGLSVVFASDRTGNGDLYVLNVQTMDMQRLTSAAGGDREAVWSPDGGTIAFERVTRGGRIWLLNLHTGEQRQLLPSAGAAPSWSPDGSRVAFNCPAATTNDLCMVNVDGTGLRNLTNGSASSNHPAWSPDGRWIAVWDGVERGIHLVSPDTGERVRLTSGIDSRPSWTSDGRQIAFVRQASGRDGIWLLNVASGEARPIADVFGYQHSPAWWGPSA